MERQELISLIEEILPQYPELGPAWSLLSAGCEFYQNYNELTIEHPTFDSFELGCGNDTTTFGLPAKSEPVEPPKYTSSPTVKTDYTRAELLDICRHAVVTVTAWRDRDSHSSHEQIGECFAALTGGSEFTIATSGDFCATDERTIWVKVDGSYYYLPTEKRLQEANGKDWY